MHVLFRHVLEIDKNFKFKKGIRKQVVFIKAHYGYAVPTFVTEVLH